jgi:hypothetical protein
MYKKQLVFTVLLLLLITTAFELLAQQQGQLRVIQDPRIDSLLKLHSKLNTQLAERDDGFLEGYRVQIFMDSGNDAVERAEQVIQNFKDSFPNLTVYLLYRQPYYRVRVGDFRTRLEAEGHLSNIVKQHSQAFVIKDKIRMPRLEYFDNQQQDL